MSKKDVAILPAKWSLDTSALLAPKGMDPTKDVPKKSSSQNPVGALEPWEHLLESWVEPAFCCVAVWHLVRCEAGKS
jgi:hypothetical protein